MQQRGYASAEAIAARPARPVFGTRVARLARRQPLVVVSVVVVAAASLAAVLAPVLPLTDPLLMNIPQRGMPPSGDHLLGTDLLGRDEFSRLLYGGRISLAVAVFGVFLGTVIGGAWGLLSGYAGGGFDALSQRFLEMVLSVPSILLAFVLAAALSPGLVSVVLAIAIMNVGQTGRLIRAVTLSAKTLEHVTAARAIGAAWPRTVIWHVAPATIAPFLVVFTAQLGVSILVEASLGFLGVGVPPPAPSWGSLVADPLNATSTPPWWLVVFPGLTIALVVLAFNLIGDALRDELDPRLRGSR